MGHKGHILLVAVGLVCVVLSLLLIKKGFDRAEARQKKKIEGKEQDRRQKVT